MLDFVKQYGKNIYSQNGEDGIIAECIKRLNITKGFAIEFGASDGIFCSNIRSLLQTGWSGIMIEADNALFAKLQENTKDLDVITIQSMVTETNINELVPDCDILSIDVDCMDYVLWQAYKHKPKIVIIEINSSLPPMHWIIPKQGDSSRGANYHAMRTLGEQKGYMLLCHTGNLVFVDNKYRELFPEVKGTGLDNWEDYFNKQWV